MFISGELRGRESGFARPEGPRPEAGDRRSGPARPRLHRLPLTLKPLAQAHAQFPNLRLTRVPFRRWCLLGPSSQLNEWTVQTCTAEACDASHLSTPSRTTTSPSPSHALQRNAGTRLRAVHWASEHGSSEEDRSLLDPDTVTLSAVDIGRWTSLLGHVTWPPLSRKPSNGLSCAKYQALRPVLGLCDSHGAAGRTRRTPGRR